MNKTRVQLVLEALDIDARKRGVQWWAKCPNPAHDDKNPSWRIRDEAGAEKDGYHACPPCGFSGGLLGLIVAVKGISFKDAKKLLVDIEKGVAIVPKTPPSKVDVFIRRREFMLPAGVTIAPLGSWPRMAAEYALKRGLTAQQIYHWGMGYADEGRLAHRIVLVTRNEQGIAKNYTARTYVDHPKRYFEPEHWEKADRNVMFGEEKWHSKRVDCPAAIVTEGGFKALAVERVMPELALAATAGSAVMPGYAAKLTRFPHIIVSTDADDTGDRIADELIFVLRRQRKKVTRLRLRDKTEHDDIEPEELKELLRWALAG